MLLFAEIWRWTKLILGWVLMVASPLVGGPLPGPFGIIGFAAGLILVLRNSRWARRIFIRIKRRYPRTLSPVRHALRPGANLPAILRRTWTRVWVALRRRWSPRKRQAGPEADGAASPVASPAAPVDGGRRDG
ncbi:MAG TPA: hypothetical protein VIG90_02480 [Pedomonas sp.]|uniref:hypothetical protein n=1 Tax=Pedomonas sp. TaxID=2976421 RepID=UPI002F4276EC